MPQSSLPGVMDALVAMFTATVPADVPVSVGGPPGGDIPARYACIGWAGEDAPGVVGGNVTSQSDVAMPGPAGNFGQQSSETYAVWCAVSTSSGDEGGGAAVAATMAIYLPLVAAIRANRGMTGAIHPPGLADLGAWQLQLESGGRIATVFFEVAVTAPWVVA